MNSRRHNGIVLLMVLVLIAFMAAAAYGVSERMLIQRKAAQMFGRRVQARALAESGVELAKAFLGKQREEQLQTGGWYDNPQKFDGVLVIDDEVPENRGRFSLVVPLVEDRVVSGIRHGLEDESARINLRTILQADKNVENGARNMLMALPGMDEAIADAILDWIDNDSETRPLGAEVEYYSSQSPPYAPRNAPPATLEELLLVRGVTPQLLFGRDAPKKAASSEVAAGLANAPERVNYAEETMDHGWAAYLTLYSMESNLRTDGTPKIHLNGDDLEKLYKELENSLGNEWATFIVAYRQNGSKGKSTPGQKTSNPQGKLDFSKKASNTIGSILDLVGVRTSAKFQGQEGNTSLDSPCSEALSDMKESLPKLLDNTTVGSGGVSPGRININQAPRIVLSAIPQIEDETVDQIIANRNLDPAQDSADHRYATWILTEGHVPLEKMKTLMPWLSAGGCVYRVESYGFFDSRGGAAAHIEALLDASKRPTSVLFWRDVSHLGIGYVPNPPNNKEPTAITSPTAERYY